MKKTFKLFLVFSLLVFTSSSSIALPTYNLVVKNFRYSTFQDAITFEIYFINTTLSPPTPIEYAGGQFFFNFNPAIAPNIMQNYDNLSYTIDSSGLPLGLQPRNPVVGFPLSMPSRNILCLAVNQYPGCGNGLMVSAGDSILIVKMRLRRLNGGSFEPEPLSLAWRNGLENPYTKIFAYINCTNTNLATPSTHSIDSSGLGGVLPVELASFSSSVNRNNVTLNWLTTTETNNSGFDIERKSTTSSEWAKVSNIAGSGTTNEPKSYSIPDRVNAGKYNYRLKQIDYNGNFKYFNLSNEVEVGIPSAYNISQNYPNPFNPTTKIDYDISFDGKVSIVLYDISGRELANLVNEVKTAGYYTLQFNAGDLASGIYFYRIAIHSDRITAESSERGFVATKKMVVLK